MTQALWTQCDISQALLTDTLRPEKDEESQGQASQLAELFDTAVNQLLLICRAMTGELQTSELRQLLRGEEGTRENPPSQDPKQENSRRSHLGHSKPYLSRSCYKHPTPAARRARLEADVDRAIAVSNEFMYAED